MTVTPNQDSAATGFDPLRYLASNPDLADIFGTDTQAASRHYTNHGSNHTTGQDRLRHTPKESGTYYLTVNALMGGTGTDLAGYTVSARLSQGSAMLAAGGW